MNKQPNILWENGSAYDLFVSLRVIHNPDEFGLRPSWAAGVRSRLPTQLRDVLEASQKFLKVPLAFIHNLSESKDVTAVLATLEALPPEDRLPAICFGVKKDPKTQHDSEFLSSLIGKQRLTASIAEQIRQTYTNPQQVTKEKVRAAFDAWSNRASFGDKFVQALKSYTKNFFREEETRIIPAQSKALKEAQMLAEGTDVLTLLEKLSAGVRMDWIMGISNLVLAPSFWGAPFVFFDKLDEETGIILFGSRPKGMTLVPGDLVPEDLLNALKALADPTRLRILRYLLEGPRSPSELAKILRLRPPTVVHHLYNLRLAGLVLVTVSPRAERRYALRMDGVNTTMNQLNTFLSGD